MMQVKIYDIKRGSTENAGKLFSDDKSQFYWNSTKFSTSKVGDLFFIVNRYDKWALLGEIVQKDIPATHSARDGKSFFEIGSELFTVADPDAAFKSFLQFQILDTVTIPTGWNWSTPLRQFAVYDLVKKNISDPEKRIEKVDDLEKLFHQKATMNVLEEVRDFLQNGTPLSTSSKKTPVSTKKRILLEEELSILTAIQTKPFILLAGLSGTGKSRLVRTLAFQTCAKKELKGDPRKPGNFELIPVRPNWHDSSELMGYISRINGEKYITTAFLKFVAKAWKHPEVPFFLCLDEMNLAPVEQYFAEYLSILETRQVHNGVIVSDYLLEAETFENKAVYAGILHDLGLSKDPRFENGIALPANLVVIGTVNMDETTHSFSRKVLDRAMTIEMNHVDLTDGLKKENNSWSYPENCIALSEVSGQFTAGNEVVPAFKEASDIITFLQRINTALEGTPFKIAYRVRDEFLIYCYHFSLKSSNNWIATALDDMGSMKILSRIEGDETKTETVIDELLKIFTTDYPRSNAKLAEMKNRLQKSGYTSYWS